ncbi:MAG: peptide chain release factor N(5)-glutamine methyltransferase [Micromonosporaceae bacterium]|nr:peptide chain release factor N(5)-glutamine methyltransferase [Micromonosporaceae bacterium]
MVTAARHLSAAGVASPRVDAELLAAHVLGRDRGALLTAPGFDAVQEREFFSLVRRRADHEPLQHLVGSAGFHRLELAVGPGVFVPRPETELLVEWGLSAIAGTARPLVVDLCAGSGAIGLAVAAERPDARVYAVERDPAALRWLYRNASARQRAGDSPTAVAAGDATAPHVLAGLDGRVDLVLANPPYVPTGVTLPPDVAGRDPGEALHAGPDGLAVIRPLTRRAATLLRRGGWLGVEHDDTQGEAATHLLTTQNTWTEITDHTDLTGRPRFTTAHRT